MIEWATILAESLQAGNALLDEDKRSKFTAFINYIFKKNRKILLFGPSGTGKSQFVQSLNGSIDTAIRTHVTKTYKVPMANIPTKFIDTPGHDIYNFDRREEVDNIIKNGIEGIINIVSYGYHESSDVSRNIIFNVNGSIKNEYLEKNRKDENEKLAEWLPRINPNQNVKWIINLVTKADIWWDDWKNVQNYYESGVYGKKFDDYRKFMKIINLPYSSVLKSFFGKMDSIHFGEQEKKALKGHLTHELISLLSKQHGK